MQRRIVCSAIVSPEGLMVVGPRHFDSTMGKQLMLFPTGTFLTGEQGFIDQHGVFLTREEAYTIAKEAGQIIRRCGGDEGTLFSENLY